VTHLISHLMGDINRLERVQKRATKIMEEGRELDLRVD